MKRLAIVVLTVLLCGCAAMQKQCVHAKSAMFGLHRRITLYDCSGKSIRTWETRSMVEVEGSMASWIESDTGQETKISGSFVVEQLP